jgi:hypothetical protein
MSSLNITRTYTASGAIAAGRAVSLSGANTVVQGNSGAQIPAGIALAAAADGESVDVCISGECLASAGATLTAGTHLFLLSDANGLLDPVSAAGDVYIARFLGERTAANGDTAVPVFVDIGTYYVAP